MALLNASAESTAPMAKTTATHSQRLRPRAKPRMRTVMAAAQCIQAFASPVIKSRMPLKA